MEDSPELENQIHYTETKPVDDALMESFKVFFRKEMEDLKQMKDTEPEEKYSQHMDHVGLYNDGRRLIRYITAYPDEVEGFAHEAKRNGESVGFEIVGLKKGEKPEVFGEFFCRGYKDTGQGIATELLKARHKELLARGITEYESGMVDEAKKVFQRAGIEPEFIETNEYDQSFYRIKLK